MQSLLNNKCSKWSKWVLMIALLASGGLSPVLAEGDDARASLLNLLPARANGVVVIDVQKILATPLAKAERWKEKRQEQPLMADIPFPLDARLAVRGFELYPEGRAVTEAYNLVLLGRSADMDRIATEENSRLEMLAGKRVVLAPGKGYFVDFGKQRLGIFFPAYRQLVGNWIRENGVDGSGKLDPYLTGVVQGSEAPLVMALNLIDVFGSVQEEAVSNSQGVSGSQGGTGKPQSASGLITTLHSLQGVRLEVNIGEEAQATLSVDFLKPVGASQADSIKSVLMDSLGRFGFGFKEFENATATVNGKSLQLQVTLDKESLKDVMELALVPTSGGTAESQASLTPDPDQQSVKSAKNDQKQQMQASVAYYQGVAKLIDSASARVRNDPESFQRLANMYDGLSRRISGFPIQNVDPDVLKFGASVSSASRALAASYRGASVNVDALNKSITYEVNTNPYQSLYNQNYSHGYYWGGTTVDPDAFQIRSNKEQVRQEQVQAVTAEEPKRQQLNLMIQDERQQMRQALNEKYGADPEKQ